MRKTYNPLDLPPNAEPIMAIFPIDPQWWIGRGMSPYVKGRNKHNDPCEYIEARCDHCGEMCYMGTNQVSAADELEKRNGTRPPKLCPGCLPPKTQVSCIRSLS